MADHDSNYQLGMLSALNAKLEKDEAIFRLLTTKSERAYAYYSFADRRIECFGDWERFFGFAADQFVSVNQITDCAEEKYYIPINECLALDMYGKDKDVMKFKLKDSNVWVELEAHAVFDRSGKPVEKFFFLTDITKYRKLDEELTYMAYYDPMTGLMNRNYFVQNLNDWVARATDENKIISVLFIDIDDFRRINDGMGILVGDETVQQVGELLKSYVGENIIASHFNGDIYTMAIYDPCGQSSADTVIASIRGRLNEPLVMTNGAEVSISISIGVAEFPEASTSAIELINMAEIVMFKAKNKGNNLTQYFDQPVINEFMNNLAIERKLDKAIKDNRFFLCYQPQFDTATKELRGMEALVRWRDENGQIISPLKFISIAERTGAIIPLGDFVLDRALSDYARWTERYGAKNIVLSINISAIQFKSKNFVDNLIKVIKKYEVDPHNIELELTESVLIDEMQDVIGKMNVLRQMGIRFSMDDFGTGYSSLSYLRQLPIDTLKIDKSFIDNVVVDEPTRTIAESIIELSDKLGFETIAEGVEEEIQYSLLRNIGCGIIQGYYLGRPMMESDIAVLYKES